MKNWDDHQDVNMQPHLVVETMELLIIQIEMVGDSLFVNLYHYCYNIVV